MERAWDPDPSDTQYLVDYSLLLRDGVDMTPVTDRHVDGLFSVDDWVGTLTAAGFVVSLVDRPLDGDGPTDCVFVCRKAAR